MPKNRIKPEYTTQLPNGTVLYINQIGDMHGNKCFLIIDTAGLYGSFVITANGTPLNGESLTPEQEQAVPHLKKAIAEIIGS